MSTTKPDRVRDLARGVLVSARRLGQDPVEKLNRMGLLLTRYRYTKVRAEALREAAEQLENLSIADLLKQHHSAGRTAYDAQRAVSEWLRAKARKEQADGKR